MKLIGQVALVAECAADRIVNAETAVALLAEAGGITPLRATELLFEYTRAKRAAQAKLAADDWTPLRYWDGPWPT